GNLPGLFEAQVARNPDAIAIEFEGQQLSYGVLNDKANRLAGYLLQLCDIQTDDLVGICLDRSVDMVVSILAVLKAGGAYVPLDPDYPPSRLSYMLADARPVVVLTTTAHAELVSEAKVICLDELSVERALSQQGKVGLPEVKANALAYIIYTSGSTGQPKGVMVEHGHVHRLLSSTAPDFGFNSDDCFCLFHSFSFDFSVWELWGALAYGGRLVVVPRWQTRSPEEFYQLVASRGVTVLNQTPTAFLQFMAQDEQQDQSLALRYVVFGGEALNLPSLSGWVARRGDDSPQLINMYGITETTVHVTFRRIFSADIASGRGSVIGRPLSDLRVYLLNDRLQPVPPGCTGEMYVGGGGVSRGYLGRPELTQSRFIDNPYVAGQRLYRTGDLGRYLDNGELSYQGRCDEQVKIRGFRIELGEIAAQLSSLEEVDSA
ncbi:amino acid adenylation domain-containing protein, partial [Rheinheimera soli]